MNTLPFRHLRRHFFFSCWRFMFKKMLMRMCRKGGERLRNLISRKILQWLNNLLSNYFFSTRFFSAAETHDEKCSSGKSLPKAFDIISSLFDFIRRYARVLKALCRHDGAPDKPWNFSSISTFSLRLPSHIVSILIKLSPPPSLPFFPSVRESW